MKRSSTAVAYPTIPIIFLGGIKPDRTPLYDTMGLAVTSYDELTRTETFLEAIPTQKDSEISFTLNGKKITGLRGQQITSAVTSFIEHSNNSLKLTINSTNYDIFSGSSDSGLAALFTALNDLLNLNYTNKQLLAYAMQGSESAGRSLFGGLTLTKASTQPLTVVQLADEKALASIKLFSIPFHYESRLSADEIHASIVTHPEFNKRNKKIPTWVNKIKSALKSGDMIGVFALAEENIRNAHELLEGTGLTTRKPDMMRLCSTIEEMRKNNILAYYLIGGGNLVTVATTEHYSTEVAKYLTSKNWTYYNYKVASAPKIIDRNPEK